MAEVVRLEFDRSRKLKCKHRYMREAVRASGKSILELLNDPFGGYPFLLQALLQAGSAKAISIDEASDLIDTYVEKHGSMTGLTEGLIKAVSSYMHLEVTPTEDEADEDGNLPNVDTPVAPGLADD
jgi:hypothetical protein